MVFVVVVRRDCGAFVVDDVSRDGQPVLSDIVSFVAAKPSWVERRARRGCGAFVVSPSRSIVTVEPSWWATSAVTAKPS